VNAHIIPNFTLPHKGEGEKIFPRAGDAIENKTARKNSSFPNAAQRKYGKLSA
jgi:hypothetical protein